eukprot:2195072-Karenia_brevis.AAC.1
MRLSYLAQDRADINEASKCLAQRMKAPNEWGLKEFKRAARYLKGNSRAALRYEEQYRPKKLE